MTSTQPMPRRLIAGRYRLRTALGSGSMGVVWSAYDEVLHRPVAIKEVRLLPGIPHGEAAELRERTLREARAIAVLSHPNVITVYDVAVHDGSPFVVMELLTGASLAEVLRHKGKLDVSQTAAVADAVAAGLAAAHRAGITHRDVKPGNVLIGDDGQIKLTDFGIARNVADVTMTKTGIVLGSPAFIAPEVAAGGSISPAADLWSLGATLFAAVEGRPPYDVDDDALATLGEVVNGAVPRPRHAGELAEVIGGLMVKDPAQRMTLRTVRRSVYPLLPEPGSDPFDLTGIAHDSHDDHAVDHDEAGDVDDANGAGSPDTPDDERTTAVDVGAARPTSAPLADQPGPLPFDRSTIAAPGAGGVGSAPVGRRTMAATVALVAASIVLFLAATGGAFVVSRKLANEPVRPPSATTASVVVAAEPSTPDPVRTLQTRTDTAATLNGAKGAKFTIEVPRDWTKFTEQRTSDVLPTSTVVHYIAPDGKQQITIERLAAFYPRASIARYFTAIQRQWPEHQVNQISVKQIPGLGGGVGAEEPAQSLVFRSTDLAERGGNSVARTTFVDAFPDGPDLWAVSVIVPTDEEDSGNSGLFAKVAPSFKPID